MGRRNDELMVRLISECAQVHWRKVYKHADTLTRLDLQISIDIQRDPQPLVWKFFHQANAWSKRSKRGPHNDVVLGNHGGATLYCGKRTSNLFGRTYARGPKTKLPEDATVIRFEVQFNKRLATLIARELASSKNPAEYARSRVVQFFEARGLQLEIPNVPVQNHSLSRSRTDVQKRLSWLERSVRNSCQVLAARGEVEAMIKALGLEGFVTINH